MTQPENSKEPIFVLGPGAFPEVSKLRVTTLQAEPLFQLKIITNVLSDLENGEDIEFEEEFHEQPQSLEDKLHTTFKELLKRIEDPEEKLKGVTVGFGSLEKFTDTTAVTKIHSTIFEMLRKANWSENEIVCADLISRGYFEIKDLKKE